MTNDKVLEHWNQRARLAERAGSDDVIAKNLEINAISEYVKNGMKIAEFGCGNGMTAFEILNRYNVELACFDFSPEMIHSANKLAKQLKLKQKVSFEVADIRAEPKIQKKFDLIYSERMIINLPDWETQARAISYLTNLLEVGGKYLMCENSINGLENINKFRKSAGLDPISAPWHNLYLSDELVASLELKGARLVEVNEFSSSYYFLSRVVNAWLAKKEGKSPSYDAPVNQLAFEIPPFGDCSQGKLWVFEKTHD